MHALLIFECGLISLKNHSSSGKIVLINELNSSECRVRFIDVIITEIEKISVRAVEPQFISHSKGVQVFVKQLTDLWGGCYL